MRRTSETSAKDALQVLVAERALRVELVAHLDELVEARVGAAQRLGVPIVDRAPVRAAAQLAGRRLDGAEVRLVLAAVVLMHRDVAGVASVRRRQPDLVRVGEA